MKFVAMLQNDSLDKYSTAYSLARSRIICRKTAVNSDRFDFESEFIKSLSFNQRQNQKSNKFWFEVSLNQIRFEFRTAKN